MPPQMPSNLQLNNRLAQLTECYDSVYIMPLETLFFQEGITFQKHFLEVCRIHATAKHLDLVSLLVMVTTDERLTPASRFVSEVERIQARRRRARRAYLKRLLRARADEKLVIDKIQFLTQYLSNLFVLLNQFGDWIEPIKIAQ